MRSDEAWPIVCRSFGQSGDGGIGIFGYGFTADERHLSMNCMACDREECLLLDKVTEMEITSAIRAFETHHLQACAARVSATRERLREAAQAAPIAGTADEVRRMMVEANAGYWPSKPGSRAKLPKGDA